jgi:uncharacterized protein (TIGR01777 family)
MCGDDQAAKMIAARRADTAAVLDAIVFIVSRLSPPNVLAQHLTQTVESQLKPFAIPHLAIPSAACESCSRDRRDSFGRHLQPVLRGDGHEVVRLLRRPPKAANPQALYTDLDAPDLARLDDFDAVIHLAGENIAQRWTRRRRASILASREDFTAKLCVALARVKRPPAHFLAASGAHYYGYWRDEPLTEESSAGDGFLAEVCRKWEAASSVLEPTTRVVHMRIAAVLARDGGALAKLLTPFKLGMGAVMGNGRQVMCWIALADLVGAIGHVLRTLALRGAVNFASPNPVTNRQFTRTLAKVLHRPAILRVPAAMVKMGFGQMAVETILANQNMVPAKLLASGYVFAHPALDDALRAALQKDNN